MHTQLYNYIVRCEDGSIVTNELPPPIAAPKSSEPPTTTAAPISTEDLPNTAAPMSNESPIPMPTETPSTPAAHIFTEPPLIFAASMSILDTELLLRKKVSIVIVT